MMKPIRTLIPILIVACLVCLSAPLQARVFTLSPLLKSALVPGWGQVSIGRSYGYAIMASEVLGWSAYYYARTEQDLKDRESYEYALKFARINPGDYSSQYYRDLSKYNSSGFEAGGYNAMVRQEAIFLFPDDLAAQQDYIDTNGIPDDMAWNWESTYRRNKFGAMRKDILELKDQAQIITGVLIANHLLSTIDILRLRPHWKNVRPSVQYYRNTPTLNLTVDF